MYMKDVCTIVYFVGIFLALLAGAPHISCENVLRIVWTKSNKGTDLLPELLPHSFAFRMNLGMKKRRNAGAGVRPCILGGGFGAPEANGMNPFLPSVVGQ